MDFDLINFVMGFLVLGVAAWFLLSSFPQIESALQNKLSDSLDRDLDDKSSEPMHEIFLGFDHDSILTWTEWLKTQDPSFQEEAYRKILSYLNNEPEQLGSVTGDAIKAMVAFKKDGTFQVIKELLNKVREKFQRFKTIDLFYKDAAVYLIRLNEAEAFDFLSKELEHYMVKDDSGKIQGYIVRAFLTCDVDEVLLPIVSELIANPLLKRNIKLEIIQMVESKPTSGRKVFYSAFLKTFLDAGPGNLNDDDQFIVEQIFSHTKIFFTDENYDPELWQIIIDLCDVAKLRTLFIKLMSEFLENAEKPLSQKQILTLISKAEPARSNFREALAKRHQIIDSEMETFKTLVKIEDLYFEKNIVTLEKSKKTKAIVHELIDDYHALEKIISLNESGKGDKGQGSVNLIAGDGAFEKQYLLRTLAANTNRSFIYVDFDKILKANFEVTNLKNMANNCKPCIVYFDNLAEILVSELAKAELLHLKELNKVVAELSSTPNIFFCANVPYKRETFKETNPELFEVMQGTSKGNYKFAFSIDKPDETKRKEILFKFQKKITLERLNKSPDYDAEAIINISESKSMLEYLLFLTAYFEFSLLVSGSLLNIQEFINEIQPLMVPDLNNLEPKTAPELEEALA